LSLIVGLLDPESLALRNILTDTIEKLFSDHWHVKTWADLMVFSSTDVATALIPGDTLPAEATSPVVVKKLGYVVDFARIGDLTEHTLMHDIVRVVSQPVRRAFSGGTIPDSPNRRSVQLFDKKAVPTLGKFNGHDEDYLDWKESTIDALGTAGFNRFLHDATVISKHPEIAESVFYSLRGAVRGGQAQSIAQTMVDEKKLDPSALWMALEEYYDTALNRANVVLFDIRRLLHLRLDPDGTASKFISDYRDCLQRLRKNNARLAEDTDTLRALLLVSIQDDGFEMVRDSIVHKPDLSIESILTELRERETSLMMKDQAASGVTGDGSTRSSRRVQHSAPSTKSGKPSDSANGYSERKWSIPRYPDSWKKAFGASMFKLLLDWRTDAHKGKSQTELISLYDTVVEKVQNSGKSTGSRAPKSSGATSTNASGTASSSDATPSGGGEGTPARKRIRLQKSRRVVTERSG
jgi:hypothetical protein